MTFPAVNTLTCALRCPTTRIVELRADYSANTRKAVEHIHLRKHTYTEMCIHIHKYTYTHIHIYTYAHTHICTYAHMHICTYAHMHICTYAHMHIHIHVYTYVYICTYIHTYIYPTSLKSMVDATVTNLHRKPDGSDKTCFWG